MLRAPAILLALLGLLIPPAVPMPTGAPALFALPADGGDPSWEWGPEGWSSEAAGLDLGALFDGRLPGGLLPPGWPSVPLSLTAGLHGVMESLWVARGSEDVEVRPTGDLDGDGLADLVVLQATPGGTLVTTLKGTDGSVVWSHATPGAAGTTLFFAPDLTGDGVADLVALHEHEAEPVKACGPTGCSEASAHGWVLDVLSGVTGSPTWSRVFEGLGVALRPEGGVPPVTLGGRVERTTRAHLVLFLGGDHDGDGLPDLVVNLFDNTWVMPSVLGVGMPGYLLATEALVVSGADGGTLFTQAHPPFPGLALLRPVGHAVGDGTVDLLWLTGVLATAYRTVMIDGRTFLPVWDAVLQPPTILVAPAGADVDGDGSADLLVFTPGAGGFAIRPLSGADGTFLWADRIDAFPAVLAPRGPGEGADLVLVGGTTAAPFLTLTLWRVDGPTGEVRFATSETFGMPDSEWGRVETSLAGDHDGDGVVEVVHEAVFGGAGGVTTRARIESSMTGAKLFGMDVAGFRWVGTAGKLQGGPADAIYVGGFDGHASGTDLVHTAFAMPGAVPLWTRVDADQQTAYVLQHSADQDGDGKGDLVRVHVRQTGGAEVRSVEALDGATGALRWALEAPALQ